MNDLTRGPRPETHGPTYPRTDEEKRLYLLAGREIKFPDFAEGAESPELLEARRVDASLIHALVADGLVKQPVRVSNAVISGRLDLRYVTFEGEVSFENSCFREKADFSFSTFRRAAAFDRSRFHGEADFRSASARYDFRLCYAVFRRRCSFMDFRANGIFRAEGVRFVADVTFEQAVFDKRVLFCPRNLGDPAAERRQTRFGGAAVFADALIRGAAHFEGVAFAGRADFRRVRMESSAHFQCFADNAGKSELAFFPTTFGGDAEFNAARVEGTAYFRGVSFDRKADFERVWFGGHALFQPARRLDKRGIVHARFAGEAVFRSAYVGGNAEFPGACFEQSAIFERVEIKHNAYFRSYEDDEYAVVNQTVFRGPVSFLGSSVGGHAEFQGAVFAGVWRPKSGLLTADFEGMNVEGTAFFNDTLLRKGVGPVQFHLPVVFTNARVNGQAKFPRARFCHDAYFTNFYAGGSADFTSAEFRRKVRFISSHFAHQVKFDDARFIPPRRGEPGSPADEPGADRESFKEVDFTDVKIDGAAFFRRARFAAPKVTFHATRFKTLNLDSASYLKRTFRSWFGPREWSEVDFPLSGKRIWHEVREDGNFDLSGATYEHITVNLEDLLLCLDPFDRHTYTLLEKSQRAIGRDREADLVYYDGSCRTGLELWKQAWDRPSREFPRAFFNEFQRKLFRYGVRPYRLLALSLLVLALGVAIFYRDGSIVPRDLRAREANPARHRTTLDEAVNMSFRQFIPVVEIPPGADWVPSDREVFDGTRFSFAGYATLHRVFGFLLIPLGVASLTGLLRRRERG